MIILLIIVKHTLSLVVLLPKLLLLELRLLFSSPPLEPTPLGEPFILPSLALTDCLSFAEASLLRRCDVSQE